jgi:hypothetical protein
MTMKVTQRLLSELEGIKTRLIFIEMELLKSVKPTRGDIEAIKLALKEYKEKKTIPFNRLFP